MLYSIQFPRGIFYNRDVKCLFDFLSFRLIKTYFSEPHGSNLKNLTVSPPMFILSFYEVCANPIGVIKYLMTMSQYFLGLGEIHASEML